MQKRNYQIGLEISDRKWKKANHSCQLQSDHQKADKNPTYSYVP